MSFKLFGALICLSAFAGALWFFTPKSEKSESFSTPPVAVPLFAQGLKINADEKVADTKVEQIAEIEVLDAANKAKLPSDQLTNEEMEKTLLKYQRQFQNCWTQRLKFNPKLAGKVLVHLTIETSGRVADIEVPQTDIKDTTMIQCLKSVISRIPFRSFDGSSITLSLPLEFSSN